MSRPPKPHALSKLDARRIWLAAQRLDVAAPFGEGPQAVADAVDHLGYVQIDTINVIERCHHHILYTRIPGYRRADLRQAQSADKSVFEYWTHALAYVPSRDFRFFMPDMRLHKREGHRWFANVKPADTRKVMRLLKGGALTIRDIEDDVLTEKEHLWASRKPSKRALQLAFYCGTVTVSERNGMLKTYELMDRHFGWDKPPKSATLPPRSPPICSTARCARRAWCRWIRSAISMRRARKASGAMIDRRVRRGELMPVALEGAGKQEHWASPEALEDEARGRAAAGAYPLAVRSPDHPAQAHASDLRLRASVRSLCAEAQAQVRLFRAAGAGRRGHRRGARSQDRPAEQEALMQKWTWVGAGKAAKGEASAPMKRRIEEELASLRAVSTGL